MIVLPALAGAGLAGLTAFALVRLHLIHRAGIIGLIVIAVAGFWPLFAVAAQDDRALLLHLAIFAAFGATALLSHRIGLVGLALALIAHGVLDGVLFNTAHVGPLWWPAFCAGYDVVLGAALLAATFLTARNPS